MENFLSLGNYTLPYREASRRADSQEVAFFANELTQYDPQMHMEIQNELTAFNAFPVRQIDPATAAYTYSMYKSSGQAQYVNLESGKATDIQDVKLGGQQYTINIHSLAIRVGFSDYHILADRYTRKNYVQELQSSALRVNLECMNKTVFLGNTNLGLYGLLNNKHIGAATAISVRNSANNANLTTWATVLADTGITNPGQKIYETITKAYNTCRGQTNYTIRPKRMLVAPNLYTIMQTTMYNMYGGVSILNQVQSDLGMEVMECPELSATIGGTGLASDAFVLFNPDPRFVYHVIATMFQPKPPVPEKMEYASYCVSRHGGLVVTQPLSVYIGTA